MLYFYNVAAHRLADKAVIEYTSLFSWTVLKIMIVIVLDCIGVSV